MNKLVSLWVRGVVICAVLFATLATIAAPNAARAQDTGAPISFLEVCADKSEIRGRLRYCDTYFQQGLGVGADPVLYLRDRITALRASHEANAEDKYQSFLTAIYITAFLAIATIVLVTSERRIKGISRWATATAAAALLVTIGAVTYGWLDKYRAEVSATLELGLLRDQIETEASQIISTNGDVDTETIRRWNDRLHEIGRRFAENYGGSSVISDIDRFSKTD